MRKRLAVPTLAAALLAAGCSGHAGSEHHAAQPAHTATTPTASHAASSSPTPSAEHTASADPAASLLHMPKQKRRKFAVSAVNVALGTDLDRETVATLGETTCELLDRGQSPEQAYQLAEQGGFSEAEAHKIIPPVVIGWCPEQYDKFPNSTLKHVLGSD